MSITENNFTDIGKSQKIHVMSAQTGDLNTEYEDGDQDWTIVKAKNLSSETFPNNENRTKFKFGYTLFITCCSVY